MQAKTKFTAFLLSVSVSLTLGCAVPSSDGSEQDFEMEFNVDERALQRALEILNKHPEDVTSPPLDVPLVPEVQGPADTVDSEQTDGNPSAIPEEEAAELMKFVDQVTLEMVEAQKEHSTESTARAQRLCSGDGLDPKSNRYHENVKDECLLPKMRLASEIFSIHYPFARCIFHQENPHRDRLAHNINGNGLAQIVNKTMVEIQRRWNREDSLSGLLKQCLQKTSNREDQYLDAIHRLEVPSAYNKKDIFTEASTRPPSDRLNPLYRDDSLCMGLMTMAIKIQEAKGRNKDRSISHSELARRYNGSRLQQRYARSVVSCVENFKRGKPLAKR